jgi:hypothetical protein
MRAPALIRSKSRCRLCFLEFFRPLMAIALGAATVSAALAATHSHPPASASESADPAAPVPAITFDAMFFDFGKIAQAQTVVHTFKVTNTGQATLHIGDVKPVCGCTSTVVGKMDLAPGETTEIEAAYTPENGFSGAARKTILVLSDDPAHPKLTLRFSAEVLPGPDRPPAR